MAVPVSHQAGSPLCNRWDTKKSQAQFTWACDSL